VLFRIDWEVDNPSGPGKPSTGQRVGTGLSLTTNTHFRFETGIVSKAEGVMATTTPAVSTSSTAAVASKQKATFGGQLDFNGVFPPDSGNTFVELGVLAKGNIDASIEGPVTGQDIGSKVATLTRTTLGAGSFRAELALRVALKQYADETLRTAVTHDKKTTYPKKPGSHPSL
jgi:hypothetical protein